MKVLDYTTLNRPYNLKVFITQLKEVGVSRNTIERMQANPVEHNVPDLLFRWLYEDIEHCEAKISNGCRYSRAVGIFLTDGKYMLLERDSYLGRKGEKYKLGGQLPFNADPIAIAIQELNEETPIVVQRENLEALDVLEDKNDTSPKLPGVIAYKEIHHFKYRINSFEPIKDYIKEGYIGRDGDKHDLLLLPLETVLKDERVKDSYKVAFSIFYEAITKSA